MRRPGKKSLRRLCEAQGWCCAQCGKPIVWDHNLSGLSATRDHVVPKSKSMELGLALLSNRIAMHRRCNRAKKDRAPTGCHLVWLAAVTAHGDMAQAHSQTVRECDRPRVIAERKATSLRQYLAVVHAARQLQQSERRMRREVTHAHPSNPFRVTRITETNYA